MRSRRSLADRAGLRGSGRLWWPYLLPAALVAIGWPFLVPESAGSDSFLFWGAGHIVASGMSPYDPSAWKLVAALGPGQPPVNTVTWLLAELGAIWIYPPQTAVLFAPIGALPLGIGLPLVQLFVLTTTAAGVILTARVMGLRGARLALGMTVAALAEPVGIGIRVGQPVGLVLLGATLAYLGARERRALPLAVGAALLSIKPHIVLVFGLGLAVHLLRSDRRLLAVTFAAVAGVTLASGAISPYPLSASADLLLDRSARDVATTLALARSLGDGLALAVAIAMLAGAASVVAWRSASPDERGPVAFAAGLALSLIVAPYAHDHDQILLVPALFAVILLMRGTPSVALGAAFVVAAAVVPWVYLVWQIVLGRDMSTVEGPLAALPVIALIALAAASWSESQHGEPGRRWLPAAAT